MPNRHVCTHSFMCLLQALRIVIADEELREELRKINSNSRLSELFLALARDLDVMEPKSPEEVHCTVLGSCAHALRLHVLAYTWLDKCWKLRLIALKAQLLAALECAPYPCYHRAKWWHQYEQQQQYMPLQLQHLYDAFVHLAIECVFELDEPAGNTWLDL